MFSSQRKLKNNPEKGSNDSKGLTILSRQMLWSIDRLHPRINGEYSNNLIYYLFLELQYLLSPQLYASPTLLTHSRRFLCVLTRLIYTWHTCCHGSCHLVHAQDHFLVCKRDFHFALGSEIHHMYPKRSRKCKSLSIFLEITLLGSY